MRSYTMKKTVKASIAILSLTALTSLAHAANPGAYAGLGLGWSKQETTRNQGLSPDQNYWGQSVSYSHDAGKLGGRIFGGYNFNQNFGLEVGLAQYANSKYKSSTNTVAGPGLNLTSNNSLEYNMQA